MRRRSALILAVVTMSLLVRAAAAQNPTPSVSTARQDVGRLIAALLGDSPLVRDLAVLSDEIGGRATGSPPNLRAVEWGIARFRDAGVDMRKEPFTMPSLWLERSATVTIAGEGIRFSPRVAAMPFSVASPPAGITAPLIDIGFGGDADFKTAGAKVKGAIILVEQKELLDVDGLFREYDESAKIEDRAFAADAAGIVYMGSRPNDLLYRHNVAIGSRNTRPMLVMESDGAKRALRLLRAGRTLTITEMIDIESGGPYQSFNVVGEIRGATRPTEIVLIGSHLDSWDLGSGSLDNGANVAIMIDVARQMKRLGIRPARTVRFALWNGEEQGMEGSFGYVRAHAAELDRHVMTMAFDIGCGRINGFFTNGRADILSAVDRALEPVAGLGPFMQVNAPIVGTDNFDFMLQGVPNLVANQEAASYGPNYHARSDTFDKCDAQQLRLNAAIAAAVALGFADSDELFPRSTRAQVEELMRTTDLAQQMKTFNLWEGWAAGTRGRAR
ncbi:MAG: M20/M25/M40 family metallo-hydrolase [Gemmatimonadota bacterium]|nr:M20/M25/M40 family metallo-hydrolase [Gemmatimonadota bacterium]